MKLWEIVNHLSSYQVLLITPILFIAAEATKTTSGIARCITNIVISPLYSMIKRPSNSMLSDYSKNKSIYLTKFTTVSKTHSSSDFRQSLGSGLVRHILAADLFSHLLICNNNFYKLNHLTHLEMIMGLFSMLKVNSDFCSKWVFFFFIIPCGLSDPLFT